MLPPDYSERQFLLGVIEYGVRIGDPRHPVEGYDVPNNRSCVELEDLLVEAIARNWDAGRLFEPEQWGLVSEFVHSLAAVLKATGKVREIHHMSAPLGKSMNDSIFYVSFHWAKVDRVMRVLRIGMWMWRIDIKDYYRNIEVDPADWHKQAFRFRLAVGAAVRIFWDMCMAFGVRNSVEIGHRFTCGTLAILERVGVSKVTGTLDDFFGGEASRQLCQRSYDKACKVFDDLGWPLQTGPGKSAGPSQQAKWNGFLWDTERGTVAVSVR